MKDIEWFIEAQRNKSKEADYASSTSVLGRSSGGTYVALNTLAPKVKTKNNNLAEECDSDEYQVPS